MGVHCDLTELGINTMAVKSLAFSLSPASLLPSLDTAMAMVMPPVIPTDPPRDSMVVMEDMAMVAIMARGRLRPSPATAMAAMVAMAPPLCMCPRLTMAMATAPPTTPTDTTLEATARGRLMPSPVMAMEATAMEVMAMDMPPATITDPPRDSMEDMAMAAMARGRLRLSPVMAMEVTAMEVMAMDMLPALSTEAPRA